MPAQSKGQYVMRVNPNLRLAGLLASLAIIAFPAAGQDTKPSWGPAEPTRPELPPDPARPVVEKPSSQFERPQMELPGYSIAGPKDVAEPEVAAAEVPPAEVESTLTEPEIAVAEPEPEPAPVEVASAPMVAAVESPEPVSAVGISEFALRRTQFEPPEYPVDALRDGTEGWVDLKVTVNPDGGVVSVEVVNAEPRRVFDRAASRAAQRWEFDPPSAHGVQEPVTKVYRLSFELDG